MLPALPRVLAWWMPSMLCRLTLKQQGEVLLLGDLNARTATADDRGAAVDALLDSVGAPRGHGVDRCAVPPRRNTDPRPVDMGGQLQLCVASGCVLLNGRACGDEHGRSTFRPYGLRGRLVS